MIIAIEGIDGAGKNTLATAIESTLSREGRRVARLAFPRYENSIFAQLVAQALHGKMGDLTDSAYAMATLFALDRRDALDQLSVFENADSILILDRYVASNAAYSWARTGDRKIVDWIADLEFSTFGLPKPDVQILLATPVELAANRAQRREADDISRTRDLYETDASLQLRTSASYAALAEENWMGPWVSAVTTADPQETAKAIISHIMQ